MKILHITNLSNNYNSGITNVASEHIISQANYADILWCNLNKNYINVKKYKYYYSYSRFELLKFKHFVKANKDIDIVVFHGIFFFEYLFAQYFLRKKNIPYIIVPHGSLTTSALSKKQLKKRLGFYFAFDSFLYNSIAVQFLTAGERDASKNKYDKRHFISPNGCYIPENTSNRVVSNEIRGVFISRKSVFYKGLDLLLEACGKIREELLAANLRIALWGPDVKNSEIVLNSLIKNYNLQNIVSLHPQVQGQEKEQVYLNSHFFILTSRSEGLPIAILEAISYGLPCLLTTETNMGAEIEKCQAGWHASCSVESIANTLSKLLKDKNEFIKYGDNAKKLAYKYEWKTVAKNAVDKYAELIEQLRR